MRTIRHLVLVLIALSVVADSQQLRPANPASTSTASVARKLAVVETSQLSRQLDTIHLPARCDEDGNVYLRPYQSGQSPLQSPIYKFTPRGDSKAVYSLAADPEFTGKGKGGADFAVSKDADVYQLAVSDKGRYILAYNRDGAIKSKIRLQTGFNPDHFAIFDSGEFLITGSGGDRPGSHAIYTGIFDRNGKLLKKIVFPEDEQYSQAAERGDIQFADPGNVSSGNFAVQFGTVVRGSDGNLYVMRWTAPARIYAVSPAGELVRSFEVSPPIEGKKPSAVVSHGGRLVIEWQPTENDPRSGITVVGLDGQEQRVYNEKVGDLACYSNRERFTFVAGPELRFAEPH